ncbi:hypothetical protein L228DRAFT_147947 [Xylona heveae TC161]|uniref:Uncharacterized protein n=1 Tax=Xylona heveae (strain CBS 132557 / TC161) TaxID=1328760 RepID=A0A165GHE6_XYLHT|nr:hypothetical protein L228DRAFT_147947 [Xylona heveae TC161]KZF22186.1 hypothetical protein L228DRAFT_147947 [Xylona heveae TC161]
MRDPRAGKLRPLRKILKDPTEEVHIYCFDAHLPAAPQTKGILLRKVLKICQKHPEDIEAIFSSNVFHWDTHSRNFLIPPEAMQFLKKITIKTRALEHTLSLSMERQPDSQGSALRALLAWLDIGFHTNPFKIDISFPSTPFAHAVETIFTLQKEHLLPWFPTVDCKRSKLNPDAILTDVSGTTFHMSMMEPLRASATFETASISGPIFLEKYIRGLGQLSSIYVGRHLENDEAAKPTANGNVGNLHSSKPTETSSKYSKCNLLPAHVHC